MKTEIMKIMKKNKRNLFILIGVIIVALIGFLALTYQPPVTQEEDRELLEEEYPNNLIEGMVKVIDSEEMTFKIEARTFLIENAQEETMEKTIKLTNNTECEIYYVDNKQKISCEFSEIGINDDIIVVTIESTRDRINELNEFTAIKITKMVSE